MLRVYFMLWSIISHRRYTHHVGMQTPSSLSRATVTALPTCKNTLAQTDLYKPSTCQLITQLSLNSFKVLIFFSWSTVSLCSATCSLCSRTQTLAVSHKSDTRCNCRSNGKGLYRFLKLSGRLISDSAKQSFNGSLHLWSCCDLLKCNLCRHVRLCVAFYQQVIRPSTCQWSIVYIGK